MSSKLIRMDSSYFTEQTPESVRTLLKETGKSVSVGFPVSEETQFATDYNYQVKQGLKALLPSVAILYSLAGVGLFLTAAYQHHIAWLCFLAVGFNLTTCALLAYYRKAMIHMQISLSILIFLNIIWLFINSFVGSDKMQPYYQLSAIMVMIIAYSGHVLLFRYAVIACLSSGAMLTLLCTLRHIHCDKLSFFMTFVLVNTFGMLIHYAHEKKLRRYFIDEKVNAIKLNLLTQEKTQLAQFSNINKLTQLPNKASTLNQLSTQLHEAEHHQQPLSLLIIHMQDASEYKHFYGLHRYEQAIKTIAKLIQTTCSRPTDQVGHFADTTLLCLLPGTSKTNAQAVKNRIADLYQEHPIPFPSRHDRPTLSLSYILISTESDLSTGQDLDVIIQDALKDA